MSRIQVKQLSQTFTSTLPTSQRNTLRTPPNNFITGHRIQSAAIWAGPAESQLNGVKCCRGTSSMPSYESNHHIARTGHVADNTTPFTTDPHTRGSSNGFCATLARTPLGQLILSWCAPYQLQPVPTHFILFASSTAVEVAKCTALLYALQHRFWFPRNPPRSPGFLSPKFFSVIPTPK